MSEHDDRAAGSAGATRIARLLPILAVVVLWSPGLCARTLSLGEAVSELLDAGYEVVFSSDLIDSGTPVELDEPTPRGLQRALAPLGLTAIPIGAQWVITRAAAARAAAGVSIRSAQNLPLEDLRASWGDTTVRLAPDSDGEYEVPAAAGTLVTILARQHQPAQLRLGDSQTVVLQPARLVENLIVTGSRHRLAGRTVSGSVTTLDAEDLAEVPSLGNDALRAVTELPGMASVGVSAKPLIRGGVQDELLVRLDGVELLDAYHLADFQNIFSAVDDRAVQSVDVYTGGFPARYGNRMSGVVDIDTGTPGLDRRTELGVSVFSLFANTQGPLQDGRTRYLLSLRRGNLDQVIKAVNPGLGTPRYYDALGRVDRDIGSRSTLHVGGFFTRDDVSLEEDETKARSSVDSRYLWLRLDHQHGERLHSSHSLTYTWSERRKQLADVDDDAGHTGFLDHRQDLRKVGARSDLLWQRQGLRMETGAELEYGRSAYDSVAAVDRGLVGAVLTGVETTAHDIHTDPEGLSGGAYWAADIDLGERLTLQPGIRWDFQDFDPNGATYHVSPRIGLRWRPIRTLALHVDAGRFHQPEALHELQAADGESSFFRPQSADHYIAGVEWLRGAWEVRAEAYDKLYRRTKRRYENVFNPFVLVPELEPDRVAIDPERARARGADLAVRRHFSERTSLRMHYGYMDAQDRLDGDWVARRWSQRHTAGAMVSWEGETSSAALAVNWHSGWRGARLPASVPEGTVLGVDQVLNNLTLDAYVSVDASVRRSWRIGRSELTAFATVTNLTDRDNLAGVEYDAEEEDGIIYLEPATESLIPLVPSIGIRISF